ncbi:MAG: GyrI-like domain-containing protein [Candidatus Aminicenantes bacterium]|nr:GyrI-like domain-containing protein [Candidatus Aminicenantes bacterium]
MDRMFDRIVSVRFALSLMTAVLIVFPSLLPAQTGRSIAAEGFLVIEAPGFAYAAIPGRGPRSSVPAITVRALAEAQAQRILPAGSSLGIFHSIPGSVPDTDFVWEAGFPVAAGTTVRPPLQKKEWPSATVARVVHTGPYEDSVQAIAALLAWMDREGYAAVGLILERYLDPDPGRIAPPERRTEICIPCRKISGGAASGLEVRAELAPVFDRPDPAGNTLAVLTRGTHIAAAKKTGTWHEFPLILEDGRKVTGYVRGTDVRESDRPAGEATEPPPPSARTAPSPSPTGPAVPKSRRPVFEIGAHASLMNSYTRGGLDDWWAVRTGDSSRAVDAGSPSYFAGSFSLFFGSVGPFKFGVGAEMNIPADHSLWGTQTYYGGRREVVLSPWIVAAHAHFRIDLGGGIPLSLTVTPSVLLVGTRGHYQSAYAYDNLVATGIGFGLSGSLEYMFGKMFGLTARLGMRAAGGGLAYEDEDSATGYSSWNDASGNPYWIDIGGVYATMGLLIRM